MSKPNPPYRHLLQVDLRDEETKTAVIEHAQKRGETASGFARRVLVQAIREEGGRNIK